MLTADYIFCFILISSRLIDHALGSFVVVLLPYSGVSFIIFHAPNYKTNYKTHHLFVDSSVDFMFADTLRCNFHHILQCLLLFTSYYCCWFI